MVGGYDNTVRVLTLDPSNLMHQLTVQAVPAQPSSLQLVSLAGFVCFVSMMNLRTLLLCMHSGSSERGSYDLYLFVGLANGVMIRSRLGEADGTLSDARKR